MYYDRTIRLYPDYLDAFLASFYHVSSTNPQHDRCPQGKDSWCFYQALAEGKQPGDQKSNVKYKLSPEVAAQVQAVNLRLIRRDLLSRCPRSATHNPNESLHAKMWAKFPKTSFAGLQRVLLAICLAVAEFNSGVNSGATDNNRTTFHCTRREGGPEATQTVIEVGRVTHERSQACAHTVPGESCGFQCI